MQKGKSRAVLHQEASSQSWKSPEFWQKYVASVESRFAKIEKLINYTQQTSTLSLDAKSFKKILTHVHSLKGSAANFGFEELSKAAKTFEDWLATQLEDQSDDTGLVLEWQHFLKLFNQCQDAFYKNKALAKNTFLKAIKKNTQQLPSDESFAVSLLVDETLKTFILSTLGHLPINFYELGNHDIEQDNALNELARQSDIIILQFDALQNLGNLNLTNEKTKVWFCDHSDSWKSRCEAQLAGGHYFFTTQTPEHEIQSEISAQINTSDGAPARILIVEDDRSIASYYQTLLSSMNCEVHIAESPQDTFKRLRNHAFELILMDYMLPSIDGLNLAKVIRQYAMYRNIPIVILSAVENHKTIYAILKEGFEFIKKPADIKELINVIRRNVNAFRTSQRQMLFQSENGVLTPMAFSFFVDLQTQQNTDNSNIALFHIYPELEEGKLQNIDETTLLKLQRYIISTLKEQLPRGCYFCHKLPLHFFAATGKLSTDALHTTQTNIRQAIEQLYHAFSNLPALQSIQVEFLPTEQRLDIQKLLDSLSDPTP
jgi:DNA-binding response OmpR family regulator/HPt (histidine-containing phosphotransfer) domain-containing protein